MKRVKEIRKVLGVSQKRVAEELKMTQAGYAQIERRDRCSVELKKKIIYFLVPECHKKEIKKSRLAKLLNIKQCNLHKYKGDLTAVYSKEYELRRELNKELWDILHNIVEIKQNSTLKGCY